MYYFMLHPDEQHIAESWVDFIHHDSDGNPDPATYEAANLHLAHLVAVDENGKRLFNSPDDPRIVDQDNLVGFFTGMWNFLRQQLIGDTDDRYLQSSTCS